MTYEKKCSTMMVNDYTTFHLNSLTTENDHVNKITVQNHFFSKRTHTLTKMNDNIIIDSAISISMMCIAN